MPAIAQGPFDDPPGPVSPGWCPARNAATDSSCGVDRRQRTESQTRVQQASMKGHVLGAEKKQQARSRRGSYPRQHGSSIRVEEPQPMTRCCFANARCSTSKAIRDKNDESLGQGPRLYHARSLRCRCRRCRLCRRLRPRRPGTCSLTIPGTVVTGHGTFSPTCGRFFEWCPSARARAEGHPECAPLCSADGPAHVG